MVAQVGGRKVCRFVPRTLPGFPTHLGLPPLLGNSGGSYQNCNVKGYTMQTTTIVTVHVTRTLDQQTGWEAGLKIAKSLTHSNSRDTARLLAASVLALPNNTQRKAAIEALFYSL